MLRDQSLVGGWRVSSMSTMVERLAPQPSNVHRELSRGSIGRAEGALKIRAEGLGAGARALHT